MHISTSLHDYLLMSSILHSRRRIPDLSTSPAEGAPLPLPVAKRPNTGQQQNASQSRTGQGTEAPPPRSAKPAGNSEPSLRKIQELGSPQLRRKQVCFFDKLLPLLSLHILAETAIPPFFTLALYSKLAAMFCSKTWSLSSIER